MPLGSCFPGRGHLRALTPSGKHRKTLWEVKDEGEGKLFSASAPQLPALPVKAKVAARFMDMPPHLMPRKDKAGAMAGKLARGGQHGFKGIPPGPKADPAGEKVLLDISVMKTAEVNKLMTDLLERIMSGEDSDKLCEAYVVRVCELLYRLKASDLHKALALMEASGLPSTQDPKKVIENRICVLAHASDDVQDLVSCRDVAFELMDLEYIGDKAYKIAVDCIDKWMQKVPLREMRRQAGTLSDLTQKEKALRLALEQRLSKEAFALSGAGQLRAFAQLLLELKAAGVTVLEGARKHKVDGPSGVPLPLLQWALLGTMRECLRNWPMDKIMVEFTGPVVKLPKAAGQMEPLVLQAVSERALKGLDNVSQMIQRRSDPVRVQAELIIWARYVCQVGESGLLRFDAPTRRKLLGNALDPVSIDFCLKAINPSAEEFPPEYFNRIAPLRPRLSEVEEIVALAREHAISASPGPGSVRRCEGRLDQASAPDLQAANPFVTVMEEEEKAEPTVDAQGPVASSSQKDISWATELSRVPPSGDAAA